MGAHTIKRFTVPACIQVTATVHAPQYFAIKTIYTMHIQRRFYEQEFWQWFLDGYEEAIILN